MQHELPYPLHPGALSAATPGVVRAKGCQQSGELSNAAVPLGHHFEHPAYCRNRRIGGSEGELPKTVATQSQHALPAGRRRLGWGSRGSVRAPLAAMLRRQSMYVACLFCKRGEEQYNTRMRAGRGQHWEACIGGWKERGVCQGDVKRLPGSKGKAMI